MLVAVAIISAALWLRWLLTRPAESTPSPAGKAPPGWVPKEEYEPTPWYKKLSPTYRPSKADKALKGWPRGSRVVHVETEKGKRVEIGILPDGEVFVPEGQPHKVTVYHRPEAKVALEFRPFIGAGLGTNGVAAVGGVDVLRAWRVHMGPGVAVNIKGKVAGVGAVGLNVWRNIDLKGYGGATLDGERVFGGGVTIGIQ